MDRSRPRSETYLILVIVSLVDNQLTGSIPPELGNSNAVILQLSNNQLSGPIPAALSSMRWVEEIDLSGNPDLTCWETQAALDWALNLANYVGPSQVCP